MLCDVKDNSPDEDVLQLPTSLLERTRAKVKFKILEKKGPSLRDHKERESL